MAPRFLIYGLIDPRNGQLRYVGQASRGMSTRLSQHLYSAKHGRGQHLYCWLRQLLDEGHRPEVEVLEVHKTAETLDDSEIFYIAYFRFIGCDLTNHADGGRTSRGARRTPEMREAARAVTTARWQNPEQRQKMTAPHFGVKQTSEQIRKRVATRIGRPLTEEHRRATSAGLGGIASVLGAEERVLAMYSDGASIASIAEKFGWADSSVGNFLARQKVEIRPSNLYARALSSEQELEALRLYQEGESTLKVGARFGVDKIVVRRVLKQHGIKARTASESHGGRSFVDQNGVVYTNQSEAARILNIAQPAISSVLRGKLAHAGDYTFRFVE